MEELNIISLGAGKQSSYMLLTALEGAYKYKPDVAIFADTGCEPQYVYTYLDWLIGYVKDEFNFDIIKVSRGNLVTDTIYYLDGKNRRAASIPLFSEISGGPINRQCTADYKISPVSKYIQSIRKGRRVRKWIGISLDEMQRMKDSPVKYMTHYYPLVEYRITIDAIVNWFKERNLMEPGKSACLICPFHSHAYWQRLKKEFPAEFEVACKFDERIRQLPNMRGKTYLSRKLKPLRDVNYDYEPSLFPELIEECYGLCGL
jgi:hypothetical protein